MGGPQWDLFKASQDALDDRLDLQPQMGTGPPEHATGLLQNGDLVREEVPLRRGGRITLIESCQGLSDSTQRSCGVTFPEKDLLKGPPGSFLQDEGSKLT